MPGRIVGVADPQPPRRRRRAVEGPPHPPPGHAAPAVATDDVAGAQPGGVAVTAAVADIAAVGAEFDVHPVGVFPAARHRAAPAHLHVREPVQSGQQFGVDERLHESVSLRPAETRVGRGHFGEHPAFGVHEPQDLVGHGVRQHPLDKPDRLEGAQRLVVQAHPARVVDQGVPLLDHHGADALQAKDIGERQADRTRTHHQDVGVVVGCPWPRRDHQRPSRKSRCSRLNVLASSYCGQ